MRKVILNIFLIFFAFIPKVFADTASQQSVSKFVSADSHYKQGQFVDAIKDYEAILKMGLESGSLYYNLANAYYKNGQLGKALVNYKRADRFIPRDGDLKFNKHLIMIQLKLFDSQEGLLRKIVRTHEEFYTREEVIIILTALGILLLSAHLFFFFIKPGISFRWLVMGLLFFAFLIYLAGFLLRLDHEKDLALVVAPSPANYEPLEKSTAYFRLKEGEEVKVISEDSGWLKIKRYDGKLGWVLKEKTERI